MSVNRYKRLLSNTVIFAVGQFASKLMVYLLIPLYTHIMTKPESSTADLIMSTANMLMPLMAVGIYDGIFRFALDAGEQKKKVYSSGMFILAGGSLLLLLLSPLLRFFDYFEGYDWVLVIYVLVANLQCTVSFYIRGLGYSKIYAAQGIINTALNISFNIIFLVFMDEIIPHVVGYVLSVAVANVIVTAILLVWCRRDCEFRLAYVDRSLILDMLKYSIPMIPTAVMWTLTSLTDRLIVKKFCGADINGLFVYSYKIPTVLTLLTTIFIEAWQFSAVNDADDHDRGNFFESVFSSFMGIIFMASSGLIAFTKIFGKMLLSPEYYEAWQYMPTLIVATAISALATFMGSVYLVKKKSVLSFVTALTGAAVNIALSWVLAQVEIGGELLGVQGVAIATIISYLAVFLIRNVTAQQYVTFGIHPLKLIVNILLVSAQALCMVMEFPAFPGGIFVQAAFLAAILIFNGKPIVEGIVLALRNKKKKA